MPLFDILVVELRAMQLFRILAIQLFRILELFKLL